MKSYIIILCFVLAHCVVFAQAGKVFRESNCASGGKDYYFFAGGDVVVIYTVAEALSNESVSVGTWGLNGDKNSVDVNLEYTKYIKPAPDAKVNLPVGSTETYDKYVAAYKKENEKPEAVSIQADGCTVYENHSYSSATELIDACLRNKGKRKYAFVSYKALDEDELQKYSAQELRIMRNEIYASYGYMFKDAKLKSYFESRSFYGNMANVDAFMNDFEKSNINLIKKVEKQKGGN